MGRGWGWDEEGRGADDSGAAMREKGGSNAAAATGKGCSVRMWGYLPAASPQRAPLLQPVSVPITALNDPLKTVCNGGCGFGIAISESGKLNTWGSTTDLGQCYLISGKQQQHLGGGKVKVVHAHITVAAGKSAGAVVTGIGCEGLETQKGRLTLQYLFTNAQEVPEPYPLLADSPIVQAAGGWAHCVAVTGKGEVYTWGWSECVPSVKPIVEDGEQVQEDDASIGATSTSSQLSPKNNVVAALVKPSPSASHLRPTAGGSSKQTGRQSNRNLTCKTTEGKGGEGNNKKRKVVSSEDGGSPESPTAAEENVFAPPCLVNLDPGIKISTVAAGGRHTLALSDVGHLWGWGYGGEGQLGLGFRMRVVSSPQHIPCFNLPETAGKTGTPTTGSYIKAIACGGRHSAVVTGGNSWLTTEAGALLTFGWGLYGQVGQGSTEDELRPCCVSAMGGLRVVGIAAGLWHTLCITDIGDIYAFGGNQFGQLGVGGYNAEMSPRLLEAPLLEDESSVAVACGARHSVVLTGSGKIFAWGWNKYGQLGLGDSNNRDLPVQVTMNDGGRAASVACGWWHTLASVHIK